MIRSLTLAVAMVIPAMADACPWQRQHCQPGTVVVYQSRSCCWQPQRVQIVRVVEVKPFEPPKEVEKPKTPIVKPDPETAKWATIKGRIVWDKEKYGQAPKRVPIVPTKDAEVAKRDGDFYTEDWMINQSNLGIKNVVVWVVPEPSLDVEIAALKKAIEDNKSYKFASFQPSDIHPVWLKPTEKTVVIDQPCCRYVPHVLAAMAGQDLLIKNSSPVPHNPKWVSRENGEFSPLLPAGGDRLIENLKAERFPIEISCSIHPWMKAYVRVFDHPYFAVTDFNGNFEIKDIPRLKRKVRMFIWQENGLHRGNDGRFGQTIELKLGTTDLKEIKFDTGAKRK